MVFNFKAKRIGLVAAFFLASSIPLTLPTSVQISLAPAPASATLTNQLAMLQTDNRSFNIRAEALNAVRDRGGIPNTQQFITQWQNGKDTSRAGQSNYVLEKVRQSSWGNYYLYKVGSKYLVVAEHIDDPNAPCPTGFTKPCKHFHVGNNNKNPSFSQSPSPDTAAADYFKSVDYDQIGGAHHYFYKG
jgi:HNH/Endo VII superfamily nuclease toxins